MKNCASCGSLILFAGTKYAGQTYCNAKCANKGAQNAVAMSAVPPEILAQRIADIHDGPCPKCGQDRLVDFYTMHFVWSAVYLAKWSSKSELCCRSCARKSQALHLLGTCAFGWWSFPGLLLTPIQAVRNIVALSKAESPNPSPQLAAAVQTMVGRELIAAGYRPDAALAPTKLNDTTRTHAAGRNAYDAPVVNLTEPEQVQR